MKIAMQTEMFSKMIDRMAKFFINALLGAFLSAIKTKIRYEKEDLIHTQAKKDLVDCISKYIAILSY